MFSKKISYDSSNPLENVSGSNQNNKQGQRNYASTMAYEFHM